MDSGDMAWVMHGGGWHGGTGRQAGRHTQSALRLVTHVHDEMLTRFRDEYVPAVRAEYININRRIVTQ